MRQVLLNICLTATGLCLFKMLIPENAMKKQADFLVACFFLASVIFFFANGNFSFPELTDFEAASANSETPYFSYEERYAEAQKRTIGREIKDLLLPRLNEAGIYPEEIYTIVNISDKLRISINEIRLVLSGKEEEDLEILKKAIYIVQEEVGEDVFVTGDFKR